MSMIQVLYDPDQLHPFDLTGILVSESKFVGLVNNYPARGRDAMPYVYIDLIINNNRTLRVYVKDEDLNVVNLTGATGLLTVSESGGSPVVFEKAGVLGAADEGEIFFYIVPTDTSNLPTGQYNFNVRIILSSGKIYTVLVGVLSLRQ